MPGSWAGSRDVASPARGRVRRPVAGPVPLPAVRRCRRRRPACPGRTGRSERREVGRLVAHERDPGCGLDADLPEAGPGLEAGVVGVDDDHPRRLEALGRDGAEAPLGKQPANLAAEVELGRSQGLHPALLGLPHRRRIPRQGVGGHGQVIGGPPLHVAVGDREPLAQVQGEARRPGRLRARPRSPSMT